MNQTSTLPLTLFNGQDSAIGITNQTCKFQITKGSAKLLEMEDVLFHHNSAVMMPDNPAVSSGGTSSQQQKVSGVRALSLVFRQHQTYPDQKLLLAGHADRSGDAKTNFQISSLRAQNVLFLLQGKRSEWADICVQRHKIEDYQQILTYFAKEMTWDCNPGAINNQWNTATAKAVQNFITLYNFIFTFKPADAQLDDGLFDTVKNSGDKGWPRELWQAVFDLYEHDLMLAATGKHIADDSFANLRDSLQFVDAEKPFVACGESFPISQNTRQNYRSQQDRRVEILFFNDDELPVLNCPLRDTSVHTEDECPIYNKLFYNFEYINPDSFFTATYHIKFVFYNRIAKDITSVPTGLQIKTWKEGATELETTVNYDSSSGIYELTVKGIVNSPREQNINFSFDTDKAWIYIADDKTMILKTLTKDDFNALPLAEQLRYYDLPAKWDSRNWECEIDGSHGSFDKKNIETTTPTKPMVFCLDDMVLCEKKTSGSAPIPITWEKQNRLTLFDRNFTILDPAADKPYWSNIQSERNYLYTGLIPADYRAIALNGAFYDVIYDRSDQGTVIGARLALKNDSRVHLFEHLREPITSGAGHFAIHFFSQCLDDKSQPCAVALVYWSCKLAIGTGAVADMPDLDNFRKTGMIKVKERWEKKEFVFIPKEDPNNLNLNVFLKFFFEDNAQIVPPNCVVKIQDPASPDYRSSMGLDTADFAKDTFQEDTSGTPVSEDGNDYYWYTMAHELGHGCGLDDEYIEPIEEDSDFVWNPVLPRFQQWYDGMPYSCDHNAIMCSNLAPRLRHVWHHCRWVNEHAKKLTGNSTFQVHHEGTQKWFLNSFNFFLEKKVENFYKTACSGLKIKNNTNGKCDLLLYQIGNDETTDCDYVELISGQSSIDGILIVRINIHWFFKNFSGSSDNQWSIQLSASPKIHEKLSYLGNFQNMINKKVNGRFWLEYIGTDRKDLKKIYLYFLPQYLFENGSGDSSKIHFSVTVRGDDPVTHAHHSNSFAGTTITIGKDLDAITLLRYMLGLETSTPASFGTKNWISTINSADLNFISQWVHDHVYAIANYTVKP